MLRDLARQPRILGFIRDLEERCTFTFKRRVIFCLYVHQQLSTTSPAGNRPDAGHPSSHASRSAYTPTARDTQSPGHYASAGISLRSELRGSRRLD